jgi:hypothetical protein
VDFPTFCRSSRIGQTAKRDFPYRRLPCDGLQYGNFQANAAIRGQRSRRRRSESVAKDSCTALLESFAAAVPVHFLQQTLHGFDPAGESVEFGELFLRQTLPACGGTGSAAEAEEQLADFVESESDLARPLNNREAVKNGPVVAALAAGALGGRKQADALVVANCGGLQADLDGDFGDK